MLCCVSGRYGSSLGLLGDDAARDLTLLLKQVKAFLSPQRMEPASQLRILPVTFTFKGSLCSSLGGGVLDEAPKLLELCSYKSLL